MYTQTAHNFFVKRNDDTNEGIKRVNYKYIKDVEALYNPPNKR